MSDRFMVKVLQSRLNLVVAWALCLHRRITLRRIERVSSRLEKSAQAMTGISRRLVNLTSESNSPVLNRVAFIGEKAPEVYSP